MTTELRLNLASDINRLHEAAGSKYEDAVSYAVEAGKLLLEAKAALPHGEWLPWLESNVFIQKRQVQRYMQLAQGRPLPLRALVKASPVTLLAPIKADTLSDLKDWTPRPAFIPLAGHWYWCSVDGATAHIVEPSSRHLGFFHVSHLVDGDGAYDCTRRPVRDDFVETWLVCHGLANPAGAAWHVLPSKGVLDAMNTFNDA